MASRAVTVDDYLAELAPEQRAMVAALRGAVLAALDPDYAEVMQYGMIAYVVPHSVHPAGYHCDPKQALPFAAIAAMKHHVSLHLMGLYWGSDGAAETADMAWFRQAWAASGKKKLDMGKACVRLKKLDDIPLDVVGAAIGRMPAARYLERYLAVLAAPRATR